MLLLFLKKPPQVDAADGRSCGIESRTHLDLLADLFGQSGGHVEASPLALDQDSDLILGMQDLAIGAAAIGAAAGVFAFDEGTWEQVA